MLKYTFNANLIYTKPFSQMQEKKFKIPGLEEKFYSKSGFFQHKIVFFPTSCIPPLICHRSVTPGSLKKNKRAFSQLHLFPKLKKCCCQQQCLHGKYITKVLLKAGKLLENISLALEVHLLITNTETTKIPYYYLSHTTTTGNMTQKKLMKKNFRMN